jgi:hypothetical protein
VVAALMLTYALQAVAPFYAADSDAVVQLRTINSAEYMYLSSHAAYGSIPDLVAAGLLDERLLKPSRAYTFSVRVSADDYTAQALPVSTKYRDGTVRFGYYSTPDAVIRYATASMRSANSNVCRPCYPPGRAGMPTE